MTDQPQQSPSGDKELALFDEHGSILRILIRPLERQGGIKGLFSYMRKLGARETSRRAIGLIRQQFGALVSRSFDSRHNIQTAGHILKEQLDVSGVGQTCSEAYAPTPAKSFEHMLDATRIKYEKLTFVDYGCGKGRMLLIAAQKSFKKIIGIEHSPSLTEVAIANLASSRNMKRACENIEVECIDAREYALPEEPCLLYLFSPFNGEVRESVFSRIMNSYRQKPRPLIIIYSEEVNADVIPVDLISKIGPMHKLKTPDLPCDPGAPVPLFYAIFASEEAISMEIIRPLEKDL